MIFTTIADMCVSEKATFESGLQQHIFQNTQVTSNKIVHKKRHNFLAQISIPLLHGVIRFVASVNSKNHLLAGWNSLPANQKLLFNGFWS